jgi:hypothetical protein
MIKTKKGELTTTQIITIIVLVVSFIVILYFVYRLNLGSTSNSDVCRNSVVLKATGKGLAGDINCKTDYVCISGGDKCVASSTVTVKVDPNNKNEILKAIADQISNCWWEYGEGQFNYGSSGIFKGSNGCALCSVVEFDDKILKKGYDLNYSDLYTYMATNKKDDTHTYLNYVYGTNDLQQFLDSKIVKPILNEKIITDNKYSIVTGFDSGWFPWKAGGSLTPPVYVTPDKISSQLKCSEFVSKA